MDCLPKTVAVSGGLTVLGFQVNVLHIVSDYACPEEH